MMPNKKPENKLKIQLFSYIMDLQYTYDLKIF